MLIDLHIHTTCSDGIYTPEEILHKAIAANLICVSVTDHDTVNGYLRTQEEVRRQKAAIKLIAGIEIDTSTCDDYTIHVLGYYFDAANKTLLEAMEWMRAGRVQRIRKMVDKVAAITGEAISFEEVVAVAAHSKSIGRPHIARVLVAKGYFKSVEEAFLTLLAKGKPAYCQQEKLTPAQAVALIHGAGGIAVLAHPSELNNDAVILRVLDEACFDGLEVWHPSAAEAHKIEYWQGIAHMRKLLMSGGSDFHGDDSRPPKDLGIFPVFYSNVKSVIEYRKER